MTLDKHIQVVRCIRAALFAVFAANLVRIAYRTWKYGGSKEIREDKFDFAEEPEIEGVGTAEDIENG